MLYRIFPREHDLLEHWKVQVLNGGKIAIRVVAFDQGVGNDFVFAEQALIRLNANGTLDTTFHGDGIVIVSAGTSDVTWNPDGSAFASRQVGETVEVRAITAAGTRNHVLGGRSADRAVPQRVLGVQSPAA